MAISEVETVESSEKAVAEMKKLPLLFLSQMENGL